MLGSVVPNPITALDRWNTAWGVIGQAVITANQTGITASNPPARAGHRAHDDSHDGGWSSLPHLVLDVAAWADANNTLMAFGILRDGAIVAQQCYWTLVRWRATGSTRNFIELIDTPALAAIPAR